MKGSFPAGYFRPCVLPPEAEIFWGHKKRLGKPNLLKSNDRSSPYFATQEQTPLPPHWMVLSLSQTVHSMSPHFTFCVLEL